MSVESEEREIGASDKGGDRIVQQILNEKKTHIQIQI